jgi:ATP-dependent helicase IRC3
MFEAHYTPPAFDRTTARKLKLSPFLKNRAILTALTLAEAINGSDTYAKKKVLEGPMVLGYV